MVCDTMNASMGERMAYKEEFTPGTEIARRHDRIRRDLARSLPDADGLLVFSRLNIYYLSGSYAPGLLWLPREGEAVLLCRRGTSRARIESPLRAIFPFRSFGEAADLCSSAGSPLGTTLAVEKGGLPWSLAELLPSRLRGRTFVGADAVLARTRAVKSELELRFLRTAGSRHAACLESLLPPLIESGISEAEISHRLWAIFFAQGHQGAMRMEHFGEDVFLGHIAAGENGNYPSFFNGPVGLRGFHPSSPAMGSPETIWRPGEPLTIDCGFCIAGYHTDRTQVYWSGPADSIPDPVKQAHDYCVRLQDLLRERLVPGTPASELARFSFENARRAGFEEGFMALPENRVPFVGHGIGLAVDEYPALAEGVDVPLEEGMVIALEPKIGIRGVGMVGTENTFEVTGGGGRCLTGNRFDIIPVLPSG
jgi:Xaa-Pro aminopeptidase